MSEDVIETLARFSPKAVDRDAMLFAAGRATAKPSRFWKWATASLLVSQTLTLAVILWPKREPVPVPEPTPILIPDDTPLPPLDPYSLLALSRNPDFESKSESFTPGPSRPPLTAFTRNFQP
jgi:hypothetical protein